MDLAGVNRRAKDDFIDQLYNEGEMRGLKINYAARESSCDVRRQDPRALESAFKSLADGVREASGGRQPQLIMVFTEVKGAPEYGIIKHLGDVVMQIPTQFVLSKNVVGKIGRGPDRNTLHNICLKINSKLQGTNQVLHSDSRLFFMTRPVMFLGADVTHPSADAIRMKPSIAAMVGSCDPRAALYNCEVRLQTRAQGQIQVEEIILETENMVKSLLKDFYRVTKGKKPERIIYYRKGVSETRFQASRFLKMAFLPFLIPKYFS